MSFVTHANNIKSNLNSFKQKDFMSPGSNLIDGAVNLLTETVSAMKHAYGEYFNEYNLPIQSIGEGMHYMTANGYCGTIPLAFNYHKIRELLLDNLIKYTIDETLFMKNIRVSVENFQQSTLQQWESMYDDYNRNPPIETSYSSDDGTSTSTSITPTPEDFWSRYNLSSTFSSFINGIKSQMNQCIDASNALKNEIKNWFDLGSEVSMNISLAQHINTMPADAYGKSVAAQEAIAVYSSKMGKALSVNNKIKTNYPDSYVARQALCLRDVVCNQLNVKSRSETIYNNMKSILRRFGISF